MDDITTRRVPYRCGATGHTVPLLRLVATVSGLGSEEGEDVVLAEECGVAPGCPARRGGRCPLDRTDAP